ncbi:dirigent protein 1-like [Andrographis paniculata]|uniref:dirigent protein 1-like n=1 Tax=Andrographis paniculata TaxID=175694 RepID=UPI0021E949AB|nr:dirigent protein 1-like [Andrographis paniculata]
MYGEIRGNQTVFSVARASISEQLPSRFGILYAEDILVTDGPDPESKKLGRSQGTIATQDLKEIRTLGVMINVVFTNGEYKGSTLSCMGRILFINQVREVPIIGGSGAFRRAWGYALLTTYSVDVYGNSYVVEYDAVVYNETYT